MCSKNASLVLLGLLIAWPTLAREPAPPRATVVDEPFVSTVLRDNRIGLDPARAIKVLLPPGYAKSKRRYPVVYFLHNAWFGPKQMIEDGRAQRLIERAFADGVVPEFIFVIADFTGPTTGSLYENSPVSGRWIDYTVDEIVPLNEEAAGRFRGTVKAMSGQRDLLIELSRDGEHKFRSRNRIVLR